MSGTTRVNQDDWVRSTFGLDPADYPSQRSDAQSPSAPGAPAQPDAMGVAPGGAEVAPMPEQPPVMLDPEVPDPSIYDLPPIEQPFPTGPVGNPAPLVEAAPEAAETALEMEELATAGALLPEEAAVPVVGWILLGATLLFMGYVAYRAYIVTADGKPVRTATSEEERQAKQNAGKPIPTAQDPQTGQPLYTPADGEYSPAIDPATGEPFQAPAQRQDQTPAQASSDDLDRHDHEDYAEDVLSRGVTASCEEMEEAIAGLIEALRERALQMEDPKRTDRTTYKGHKQRYDWARDLLRQLVELADSRGECAINTGEAKDWIDTDPPPPQ